MVLAANIFHWQGTLEQMTSLRKTTNHAIDYLLVVRGLAAIAIVLRHVPLKWKQVFPGPDLNWLLNPFGYIPVLMFFAISGYLSMKSFCGGRYDPASPKSIADYYRNRFLRIIPLYYFTIIVCIFIYPDRARQNPLDVAKLFLFLMNYEFPRTVIFNVVYWVLPIEMLYYLFAPLIFLLMRQFVLRFGWFAAAVLIISAYAGYSYYLFGEYPFQDNGIVLSRNTWTYLHCTFTYNAEAFLLGGLTAYAVNSRTGAWVGLNLVARNVLKSVFVAGVCAVFMRGYYTGDYLMFQKDMMDPFTLYGLVPAVGLLIGILALLQDTRTKGPKQQPMFLWRLLYCGEWIGLFSYGIYLWNIPIMDLLSRQQFIVMSAHRNGLLSLCTILLTIILSMITYLLIEKPFLRFRSRPLEQEKILCS